MCVWTVGGNQSTGGKPTQSWNWTYKPTFFLWPLHHGAPQWQDRALEAAIATIVTLPKIQWHPNCTILQQIDCFFLLFCFVSYFTVVAVSPSEMFWIWHKKKETELPLSVLKFPFSSLSLQRSIRRTVQIPVRVRRPVISPATAKSSPWSKSPARARLAISPGNTTSQRTTSGVTAASARLNCVGQRAVKKAVNSDLTSTVNKP